MLGPHPEGPLVVAVDIRQEDWRCAVAALDGVPVVAEAEAHAHRDPAVIAAIARAVRRVHDRHGSRVRAVSVAVAATVRNGGVVQSATLGWGDAVDLRALTADLRVPLLIGNDATLAGVAEARRGAAAGAAAALYVTIEVGVGGTLVVDGRAVGGATGAGGEFGHLPFGDPALRCPCGARGCWELTVDGRAIARHLGDPPPRAPAAMPWRSSAGHRARRPYGPRWAGPPRPSAAGWAGLVNALDPDVVVLGGLAEPLRAAAEPRFSAALTDGLMRFRRAAPPPVVAAALGETGALHGAAASALDQVLTEDGLNAWAAERSTAR